MSGVLQLQSPWSVPSAILNEVVAALRLLGQAKSPSSNSATRIVYICIVASQAAGPKSRDCRNLKNDGQLQNKWTIKARDAQLQTPPVSRDRPGDDRPRE